MGANWKFDPLSASSFARGSEDSQYRHCWLVSFAGQPVIDSYREHPDHVKFADERFRPYAGDRVSIDFEESDKND
ncbi:MAG: Dabb family protein [Gammaproteobacteria bacterium]|jgi:fructose-bisphosphate aldolase class II|nr:Dabb family protein [Gammaproteobacteria bacterium]